MTAKPNTAGPCFTLIFERELAVPLTTLWQVWTAPAARAAWSAPHPGVQMEFVEADTRVGGREVVICRPEGQPENRCESGWLHLDPPHQAVNYEFVSGEAQPLAAALVTAQMSGDEQRSRLKLSLQVSPLAADTESAYREGYGGGLDHLVEVASRTMILQRRIAAPRSRVWAAWMNPQTLPQWWGPDGFSCRTQRIDLRAGGEWVFDMIGPDGTVYPNHHRYRDVLPESRLAYELLWGENGPKHADAWAGFEEENGTTLVTLGMVFSSEAEFHQARGFGAIELGLQTLGKLERFVQSAH